jgi:IclR family transcriptional regulator, acetate operon repressor
MAKANFVEKKKRSEESQRLGIQVIARAASILRALERHPEGLTLGQIAGLVDLPRSTVQRIVDALHDENLVIAGSAQNGVRLGPALIALASAARLDIAEIARPVLVQLAKETGETVDLAVFDQDKVVFVDQIPGTHRLQAVSAVGVSFPLHTCAPGKAILSELSDAQLERLRKRITLSRSTGNTLVTWKDLDREITRIREHGLAFDNEEQSMGISAVSIAIRGPKGELAAVSIPVPTQRFVDIEKDLENALLERCRELRSRYRL